MMIVVSALAFALGAFSRQKLRLQPKIGQNDAQVDSPTPLSLLTARTLIKINMVSGTVGDEEFSSDELALVEKLYAKTPSGGNIREAIEESLPSLPPSLVLKLRQPREYTNEAIRVVSNEMNKLLDSQLEQAKYTLQELLDVGEIRKLDSLIGKASNSGKLDAAFFNVLSINIKDAAGAVLRKDDGTPIEEDTGASRLQILQHVYTRCQEEVEKSIPPGLALLNKLIRQEQESIRTNLYYHYLTPQSNKIITPDGKEVELKDPGPPLVSLDEFISAISKTVVQIRTAEKAGATDRAASAGMVESCRLIAKEARIVVGRAFGIGSEEMKSFESGLQPVFRPMSADSPFINGETS